MEADMAGSVADIRPWARRVGGRCAATGRSGCRRTIGGQRLDHAGLRIHLDRGDGFRVRQLVQRHVVALEIDFHGAGEAGLGGEAGIGAGLGDRGHLDQRLRHALVVAGGVETGVAAGFGDGAVGQAHHAAGGAAALDGAAGDRLGVDGLVAVVELLRGLAELHVVARLEVVHHLRGELAVGDDDTVDAQHHHRRQQLLPAGGQLGARGGHQQRFDQFVVQALDRLVQRQRLVDAGDGGALVHAFAHRDPRLRRRGLTAAAVAEIAEVAEAVAAVHRNLEHVRKLFDEMVAALVLGGVLVAELVEAFGHVGDQLGVGLHLFDRALHDRMEHAVDQTGAEIREIHRLQQRAGRSHAFARALRGELAVLVGVAAGLLRRRTALAGQRPHLRALLLGLQPHAVGFGQIARDLHHALGQRFALVRRKLVERLAALQQPAHLQPRDIERLAAGRRRRGARSGLGSGRKNGGHVQSLRWGWVARIGGARRAPAPVCRRTTATPARLRWPRAFQIRSGARTD
ncbi:MAG: hypothetical protein HOP03_05570 [Lysobacter sp.]|nr:hypothetical protein [Lysobacter sp.]